MTYNSKQLSRGYFPFASEVPDPPSPTSSKPQGAAPLRVLPKSSNSSRVWEFRGFRVEGFGSGLRVQGPCRTPALKL